MIPIDDLLDEEKGYPWLLDVLHPKGLHCPLDHPLPAEQAPHDRHRAPLVDYRCRVCGKGFNAFTNTELQGIRYRCSTLVMILRAFAPGVPTQPLAAELGLNRHPLLDLRHRVQRLALERFSPCGVSDLRTEVDEMDQKAGEKGIPPLDPDDPPRQRANRFHGHSTFAHDRPPIVGVIGRDTGAVALRVVQDSTRATLHGFVVEKTHADCIVNTDEWHAYNHLSRSGRTHRTVHHGKKGDREWARDDDGDGVREVHCNTIEGFWTGLRNFLRPFRGSSKWFLDPYVAFYAALHNYAGLPLPFLSKLLRSSP